MGSTTQPLLRSLDLDTNMKPSSASDIESGYASASPTSSSSPSDSLSSLPQISLTPLHLRYLNQQMEHMSAVERLRFSLRLFPNLFQTTAFGLTGLVTIDMLAALAAEDKTLPPVEAIFLDTLYHFEETYDLVNRVKARYPGVKLHIYQPDGASTAAEFEDRYGQDLHATAPELYDWIAKVEPQARAWSELRVAAVLTGRRRSQGGERGRIPIVEIDEERGIVKINPLCDWSFAQVRAYIAEHKVPYNVLLDRGYKSVGDWHSTTPVGAGEDERAGRWKGQAKTECGIHNKKSRYAQFLAQQEEERKKKEEEEQQHKLEGEREEQKGEKKENVERINTEKSAAVSVSVSAVVADEVEHHRQQQLTSALEQVEREQLAAEEREKREQQQELRQDFATGRWVTVVC